MANALYTPFINAHFAAGSNLVNLSSGDIRIILIDAADYTVNLTTHDYLDDVAAGARVATVALTGESWSGKTFDANDAVFTSVTGDVSEAIIVYCHTGTESTSRLIAYLDTLTGLPVTPNGADITVTWDAAGIFTI